MAKGTGGGMDLLRVELAAHLINGGFLIAGLSRDKARGHPAEYAGWPPVGGCGGEFGLQAGDEELALEHQLGGEVAVEVDE